MKKERLSLAALAIGIICAATTLAISPASAQPLPANKTYVSGIDLVKACTQQIGAPHAVVNVTSDVIGLNIHGDAIDSIYTKCHTI
jgi:hypothetical protein